MNTKPIAWRTHTSEHRPMSKPARQLKRVQKNEIKFKACQGLINKQSTNQGNDCRRGNAKLIDIT